MQGSTLTALGYTKMRDPVPAFQKVTKSHIGITARQIGEHNTE